MKRYLKYGLIAIPIGFLLLILLNLVSSTSLYDIISGKSILSMFLSILFSISFVLLTWPAVFGGFFGPGPVSAYITIGIYYFIVGAVIGLIVDKRENKANLKIKPSNKQIKKKKL
jgi:hypothetical protein